MCAGFSLPCGRAVGIRGGEEGARERCGEDGTLSVCVPMYVHGGDDWCAG